jgi:hypothetical protein
MEMMVHPAAWRCSYYLSSGSRSTKRRILFFNVKKHVKHTVGNGSFLKHSSNKTD